MTFLEHIEAVEDHRVPGMTTYPLGEILLATLVGTLCGMEDWEAIELFAEENLAWLRKILPFKAGIPQAQTFRKVFRHLDHRAMERSFAAWVASLAEKVQGVVAIDGKSVRGSRESGDKRALHIVSAYAHEAGLVIGARAVEGKSNEITAIPELLDMLVLTGTIVTIDAMGTQKDIAQRIVDQEADYVLALKGNQGTLAEDVRLFFEDPASGPDCRQYLSSDAGHGRIEERLVRVAGASWLAERHPEWKGLRSIAAVTATRTDKKSGATSKETRFYISSLPPEPEKILAATRAHWSVENNLHWQLDVTFREDHCQVKKDAEPLNLSIIRRIALNMLKRSPEKRSTPKKRIKAALNPHYRWTLLAA